MNQKEKYWRYKDNKCIDCSKIIKRTSKRCNSCRSKIDNKGRIMSEETKEKIGNLLLGRKGVLSRNWKGGITSNPNYRLNKQREWSKNNKDKIKLMHQKRLAVKKAGGILENGVIQKVYEDNIKEFGTLTCIYCIEKIAFGKDTLEHILPLSRGGTNDYENLSIACNICNSTKKQRTIEEWVI
jgi:5-methylcytosine-specific restriction endonuclease McrA